MNNSDNYFLDSHDNLQITLAYIKATIRRDTLVQDS